MTEPEHKIAVEKTIEEIRAGNTFQCQIGFKTEYEISGEAILFYEELRKINPSPHSFYFKHNDLQIVGASPELLFKLQNGEMETYPLAGSIKRGRSEIEDLAYAKHLLNDPKEIAEHNMLVDLHRNDIGRVAKFGTVKVRRLMDIKKFSHIQHISSEVSGIIKHGEDMFSALSRNFPAGTLSGAPKIESMKIIKSLEQLPRGPYGGAFGHFGFNGNCAFAIPIRTLFIKGSYGFTQASGGIVYDSKPENEFDEIMRKSAAVKKALEKFM
jgi:anthranilate synthase component 1